MTIKEQKEYRIKHPIGRIPGTYKHSKETKRKIGLSNSVALKGRKIPDDVRKKMGISRIGSKHPRWTGGTKSYKHKWVEKEKGKAKNYVCEICGKKQACHWSNIDHKYKKDLRDWRALCVSCHKKWDIQFNNVIIFNRYGKQTKK
jgi:hypothetical protein